MKTTDAARGNWKRILPEFGIPADVLDNKHHPCPCTGEGADRFRFADQNGSGSYFCACSAGEEGGFGLLKCKTGKTFRELAQEVDKIVGNTHTPQPRPAPTYAERLRMRAKPAPRSGYLESRGLEMAPGLLFARDVEYHDDGALFGKFDAMLAPITRGGEWLTFHATYLRNGRKAEVPSPRKILPGPGNTGGGVALYPAAEEMGVAEGIETAIAARMLFDCPTHSALNAGMLAKWEAPAIARRVYIFADNDRNFAGHAGAYALAHRLAQKGIEPIVMLPPNIGTDWNDVLIESRKAKVA